MPETTSSTLPENEDVVEMEDIIIHESILEEIVEPRYNLRSCKESDNNTRDSEEEVEIEEETLSSVNFDDIEFDSEDLQGATLDDALDAIEGKTRPENIASWPNDAYREFMKLIVEGNISNNIGDKIIKFFNNNSNLEKSPLPNSTKNGKDFLNQIKSPSIEFKEKVVANYKEVDFKLYYRPIFHAIQALLQ